MNYKEAVEKSFKVKWKTSLCPQGEECWCRIVEPDEVIIYNHDTLGDEELYIAGAGDIAKDYAEHLVTLHNNSI